MTYQNQKKKKKYFLSNYILESLNSALKKKKYYLFPLGFSENWEEKAVKFFGDYY